MQISAECRWFTHSKSIGSLIQNWFLDPSIHGQTAGGGRHRQDCYLFDPKQIELGIKRRGSKPGVEIKGLVCIDSTHLRCGSLDGNVEVWCKWTSTALEFSKSETIAIEKTRWLRKFETENSKAIEIPLGEDEQPLLKQNLPARGCNVEFTEIEARGRVWFSLGLEAFGELENIIPSICDAAKVLASRNLPQMTDLIGASYPQWIRDYCALGSISDVE